VHDLLLLHTLRFSLWTSRGASVAIY
jgi:hypothetical protein